MDRLTTALDILGQIKLAVTRLRDEPGSINPHPAQPVHTRRMMGLE